MDTPLTPQQRSAGLALLLGRHSSPRLQAPAPCDGDLALIRRTEIARDGEIVVALVHGEEATLKYLRREGGMIRLDPANAAYDPQYYRPAEVQVQGKLAGLLRRYH